MAGSVQVRISPSHLTAVLLTELRPKQWLKNALVFAALVFSGRLGNIESVTRATWAFLVFCAISSAGYVLNDLADLDVDRTHPTKRNRPLASGLLERNLGLRLCLAVAAGAMLGSLLLGPAFSIVVATYGLLTAAYSLAFKHVVLIDVAAIASGFVLRSVGGAVALGVPISGWLYLLTILVAIFVVLGKRRSEVVRVTGVSGGVSASSVGGYSLGVLDGMALAAVGASVISYALYTLFSKSLPSDHLMVATVPLVAFGLLRYLFLVRSRSLGGAPEDTFLGDPPLMGTLAAWISLTLVLLYWVK